MNYYTFHINLYDVAFLGTLFVGLTFAALLWFTPGTARPANRVLTLALTCCVLWAMHLLVSDLNLPTFFSVWKYLPLRFSLAIGPLIFFYVLKTTQADRQFKRADLLHFVPLLFEIAVPVFPGLFGKLPKALLSSLAFISIGTYLYLSLGLIEKYYRQQKFNDGDRYRNGLRWLRGLIRITGLLWLLWIPLTAINHFLDPYHSWVQANYILYLLQMWMMIWISAKAFLRLEAVALPGKLPVLKPLLPDDLKQKGIWLKRAVKEHRYYEDPELSLNSLAGKLCLTTHDLSRIVNQVLKKSFSDFLNEYRIQAAIRKMQDPAYDHITLLGIAYESGFNSQSSFNRIFKQATGKSPQEFKNGLKKELPSYNMGSAEQTAQVISDQETTSKWFQLKFNRNYMLKNYLKIARRNLLRNKSYTAINVVGLAVGIAVCMVIFIIIQFQTSFDDFHTKKDRIFRLLTEYHSAETGNVSYGKAVPFPVPLGLKTSFPQVEQVAPVFVSHDDQLLVIGKNGETEKDFKEQHGVFYASPAFFKVFDFPLLAGSYESLKDPNNVLLTQDIAEKYFGNWKSAIGRTIKLRMGGYMFEHGTDVLKVSGILASIPANTDFQLKAVVAYGTGFTGDYLSQSHDWDASVDGFGCYVLLKPGTSAADFNRQLGTYCRTVKSPGNKDNHTIQPLTAVHYDTQVGDYSNKTISHQLINVLWLIAGFILLIACVNFINLSTAQAVNRAKEVGVRKVLGSSKSQLRAQFIVETFLIVIGAVLLAVIITVIALPPVSRLLELKLEFSLFSNPAIILFLLTATIIVTALAGFYPSIVLSGFNPVNALKSKINANSQGISLRRGLVVFQFIIAQALIIGTLIIAKQMDFFMNQPLGFDKDAVINVPFRIDTTLTGKLDYLKKELLSLNGVQTVSLSSNTPVESGNDTWSTLKFDHSSKEADFKAITKFADEAYVPAYKLPLIAGRNVRPSDLTREFLVNESLMKALGIQKPEDILNKEISIWNGQITCPVVGVLKDFNDRSFHNQVAPMLITTDKAMYNQLAIKLTNANILSTLQAIKKVFNQTYPDFVYEYKFLDEKIDSFYKQENQLAQLYKIFAVIAIFLSCLGLYGLASFMAVQRVKEVGIRKVLGASTGNIVYLFSKEFLILIAIAFGIATPVAWYYMQQWLQNYAYRINISWWLIAAGGIAAIIIAMATISFQAVKAALANPVKSLRSE